ncbi:MAG: hypothetical protein AAFO82_22585 [Bacteroidota bacterium]
MNAAAIRSEVHNMVEHLDNSFLKAIRSMLATYLQAQTDSILGSDLESNLQHASKKEVSSKLDMTKTAAKTRKNISLAQLKKEQNYQAISYKKWRAKADGIEWDESLEELLAAAK